MSTGVSPVHYLESLHPLPVLELDNSYFLVKLFDAQAFFRAGWLTRPGYLVIMSSVENTFQAGPPIQSLHQIKVLHKNTPCHLGLSMNLTEWLPARPSDSLNILLKYIVTQDSFFKDLADKIGKLGLDAKVATTQPEIAIAAKVSMIVGNLISYLLGEESQHEIFSLNIDLNLANMKTGYYAVFGSHTEEVWPAKLLLDSNKYLTDQNQKPLNHLSYVMIEVLALKRRGLENARKHLWWKLLETGKQQILATNPTTSHEKRKALDQWRTTLAYVQTLAREESSYLIEEVSDIIRTAHVEIEKALSPKIENEAFSGDILPDDWKELLGVCSVSELKKSVRDYQDSIEASKLLLAQYQLIG